MKTLYKESKSEIVEKKSRFICSLYHVENREEAENIISRVKKEYYDARHNCSAYTVFDFENDRLITKTSDDGEPSGTAGSPILNALKSAEMINTLAIVTRYFGGVLLGTGGLVRAYKQATSNAIEKAELFNVEKGNLVVVELNYDENEKLKHFCKKNNIQITKTEYMNNIKCYIEINDEKLNCLRDLFVNNNTTFEIVRQMLIKTA